jgi:hypothetical protein
MKTWSQRMGLAGGKSLVFAVFQNGNSGCIAPLGWEVIFMLISAEH